MAQLPAYPLHDQGLPLPMVGRAAERVLLREQLAAAESGNGRFVIVGGEAGIGKTTIARDLTATARDHGCKVLVGHCYDLMAAAPYGVWRDLIDRTTSVDEASGAIEPPDLERVTNQAALFGEVRDYLERLTGNAPGVLVLEDLHWADPASLSLLRHVASHLDSLRLLLLVTYRIDELTRETPFYQQLPALIRETDGVRLDLRGLRAEELRTLVAERYGMPEPATASLVDYLDRHAEGNPFFAMEILRTLEERGDDLRRSEAGWEIGQLDQVVVPSLVSSVIEARLTRLGEETKEPLSIAAVIGHEVSFDLWARVVEIDRADLLAVIDQAIQTSQLVASADGSRLQFVHALTREALFERVNPVRRAMIHARIADELLTQASPDPDRIAYHLSQAGDPRAPEWLIRAGEQAQRAFAWLTAGDRFLRAAEMLEGVPGADLTRARLLYRCGRLQRYSDANGAVDKLNEASRLATQAGDQVLAADAIFSCGIVDGFADKWTSCVERMTAGMATLESLPATDVNVNWATANWMADVLPQFERPNAPEFDSSLETLAAAGMNHRRGTLSWFVAAPGHLLQAREIAESFLQVLDGIDGGPMVMSSKGHAEHGRAITLAALGEVTEASKAFADARVIYGRLDHHSALAFSALNELNDLTVPYLTRDVAARNRLAEIAGRELAQAGGAFPSDILQDAAPLVTMYLDGRWSEARSIVSRVPLHGGYVVRRQVTMAIARIAYHQGQLEEVWSHILSILPDGVRSEPGSAVLLDALAMQRLAIEALLEDGEVAQAEAWLDAHARWLAWSEAYSGQAAHALASGKIAAASGNLAEAVIRTQDAIDRATAPEQPPVLLAARRFLGECQLLLGIPDVAEREAQAAFELAQACELPYERALAQLLLARIASGHDRARAMQLAEEARTTFQRLEAAPALARADALLAIQGGRNRVAHAALGLSSRELDVLHLVSHGLTDADIAEQLFISPRTVSQHLRSVYGKLGIHSRAAATRYALEHDLA